MEYDRATKVYLNELAGIPPLTAGEETGLLKHLISRDELAESARQRLIEAYMHVVVPIAERCLSPGMHMLELIVAGNSGLRMAAETFVGSTDATFPAHTAACIEKAMAEAIARRRDSPE